jgi:hypothetical protein
MTNKRKEAESPVVSLKNESARQRWELFHRAIVRAKQSINEADIEADAAAAETGESPGPLLTIIR